MLRAVLARVDRFMAAQPWDHNQHYHRWLLAQMPTRFGSALDVGCGTGELARTMAVRGPVVAIDTDDATLRQAREVTARDVPVSYRAESLLSATGTYDVITAVAVLHHTDLAPALRQLRGALAPGGRLLVVGCYREATWTDHAASLVALPTNMAVGTVKNAGPVARRVPATTAPTARPTTSLAEVRLTVRTELPGATLRRGLFWRYLLRYDASPLGSTLGPHDPDELERSPGRALEP